MDAPEWLGTYGIEKWHEKLVENPEYDRETLVLYCEAWDDFRKAIDSIAENGATAFSEKGGVYQHPSVGIKNKAVARLEKFGDALSKQLPKAKKAAARPAGL